MYNMNATVEFVNLIFPPFNTNIAPVNNQPSADYRQEKKITQRLSLINTMGILHH